jgi:hypothetical protein
MRKERELVRLDVRPQLDLMRVAIILEPSDIAANNLDVDDRDGGF